MGSAIGLGIGAIIAFFVLIFYCLFSGQLTARFKIAFSFKFYENGLFFIGFAITCLIFGIIVLVMA